MSFRIDIVCLIFLSLVSCKRRGGDSDSSVKDSDNTLVEVIYLMDRSDRKDLKIIDFRTPETYLEGHIPGAINIWRDQLVDEDYPYGGMMPSKDQVEGLFSSLGIENNDMLLVYDDKGSVDAARLWWILSYYSFDRVKILNGGLSAWKEAGGSINKDEPETPQSQFILTGNVRSDIHTNAEQLEKWVKKGNKHIKIVDARTKEEFTGQLQKKGATKSGRIPGSIRIDWIEAIDTLTLNKFKSKEELMDLYNSKGVYNNDSIIVYCHSGSRSSHTTFVLREILDYKSVMNYDGSWTEWSYYDQLPIEKDSINLIMR